MREKWQVSSLSKRILPFHPKISFSTATGRLKFLVEYTMILCERNISDSANDFSWFKLIPLLILPNLADLTTRWHVLHNVFVLFILLHRFQWGLLTNTPLLSANAFPKTSAATPQNGWRSLLMAWMALVLVKTYWVTVVNCSNIAVRWLEYPAPLVAATWVTVTLKSPESTFTAWLLCHFPSDPGGQKDLRV